MPFLCGLRFPLGVANIVYFDLETQKIASEVGGWGHIDKMGLAVAVLYHTDRSAYEVYLEKDADRLIADLRRADLVVGFNVIRFDYAVLSAYSVFDFSTVPTLDLMVSLEEKIGHRVGLDAVADATCGVKKPPPGRRPFNGGGRENMPRWPSTVVTTSRPPAWCMNMASAPERFPSSATAPCSSST